MLSYLFTWLLWIWYEKYSLKEIETFNAVFDFFTWIDWLLESAESNGLLACYHTRCFGGIYFENK